MVGSVTIFLLVTPNRKIVFTPANTFCTLFGAKPEVNKCSLNLTISSGGYASGVVIPKEVGQLATLAGVIVLGLGVGMLQRPGIKNRLERDHGRGWFRRQRVPAELQQLRFIALGLQ